MSHVRLALALVLTSMFAFGQSERGNISGIISDPQGAAVAGAVIKVINRSTNATVNAVAARVPASITRRILVLALIASK